MLGFLLLISHSLRRKFQQNQEDCTFTVLALLPTAAENILEALPVEQITHELQQKKAERLGRSTGASDVTPSEVSSGPPSVTDENGSSIGSLQSESYVHASQIAASSSGNGEAGSQGSRKSKAQLWAELKISCQYLIVSRPLGVHTDIPSRYTSFHADIHTLSSESVDPYPT